MGADRRAGGETVSWVAAADHAGARARRAARAQRDEQRTKSTRVGVVFSLFLALLTVGLLIGGHAMIDPMLRAAAEARGTERPGAVILATPDGLSCRHLSFDNATAELTEGAVDNCERSLATRRKSRSSGFSWGR